jgi:hypothetical protein
VNYQSINKKDGKSHFNISKLHSITHYVDQIRLFESAVEMNSAHFEASTQISCESIFQLN